MSASSLFLGFLGCASSSQVTELEQRLQERDIGDAIAAELITADAASNMTSSLNSSKWAFIERPSTQNSLQYKHVLPSDHGDGPESVDVLVDFYCWDDKITYDIAKRLDLRGELKFPTASPLLNHLFLGKCK